MSVAYEIWDAITARGWSMEVDGGDDGGDIALIPSAFSKPLPPALIETLKKHKPEVIALLHFHEQADHLLIESSARLAENWPQGYDVESDPRWQSTDRELQVAFVAGDPERLRVIIELRERLAGKLFEAYKKERAR